jgi:hypothetical protein
MTEDEKAHVEIVVDDILDRPGDLYYPFADLRLKKFPAELRVTRELQDTFATAMENPALTGDQYTTRAFALCLWAIQELESELSALRRERSGGEQG